MPLLSLFLPPSLAEHLQPHSSHQMKVLPLFALNNNSLPSRMKKGMQSFCGNAASTSTLRQSRGEGGDGAARARTLEEMILQLEIEEAEAGRPGPEDGGEPPPLPRRMSCVDGADIMRSARDALGQYPRFSLDGRDAMCRSSFSGFVGGRKPSRGPGGSRAPATVAGERVVWCRPGVVARLMGLDAVPVPAGRGGRHRGGGSAGRRQSLRRMGRSELEKERLGVGLKGGEGGRREDLSICLPFGSEENQTDWGFKRAR